MMYTKCLPIPPKGQQGQVGIYFMHCAATTSQSTLDHTLSMPGNTFDTRVESGCTVWQYSAHQTKLGKYSVIRLEFG